MGVRARIVWKRAAVVRRVGRVLSRAADRERYQLVVVAGGKGGKTLAMDMARSGWRVAMVEHVPEMVAGTCIKLACIPTRR